MSRFRFHHWIVAAGAILIILGIANAAFLVPAAFAGLVGENAGLLAGEPDSPSQPEQAGQRPVNEPTPRPARIVHDEVAPDPPVPAALNSSRQLPELYEAEMMVPQELAEVEAVLPAPAAPEIPTRLIIPEIELDAPIMPVEAVVENIAGKDYQIWRAPDEFGAGWHASSATLGAAGNTVLNGHHNVYGEVFKRLVDLEPGDEVIVQSESGSHRYKIVNRMILEEKYAPIEQRVQNAQWILPSLDERLTLVTCWPYESNTHRLVLVAKPLEER
jgi:LPXTG-site transpeptidase (sortase) family protein